MAIEIERKYLLSGSDWREQVYESNTLHQGYLSNNVHASVRIRIENEQANINIKGMTIGAQRPEYEYPIPLGDAKEMLAQLCAGPQIHKTRHLISFAGKLWEIDEFHGDNAGLIVAEVELDSSDEQFELPHWVGREVTDQGRYYNVSLAKYPYQQWTPAQRMGEPDSEDTLA